MAILVTVLIMVLASVNFVLRRRIAGAIWATVGAMFAVVGTTRERFVRAYSRNAAVVGIALLALGVVALAHLL
jgi:hypothetical protein